MSATSADHGTTRFISLRNSRLRVLLVDRFSPRPSWFGAVTRLAIIGSTHAGRVPVLLRVPSTFHLP